MQLFMKPELTALEWVADSSLEPLWENRAGELLQCFLQPHQMAFSASSEISFDRGHIYILLSGQPDFGGFTVGGV